MSASEEPWRGRSSAQAPALTETALLAVILILFVFLHVLAGTILQRAGTSEAVSSEPNMTLQYYD
jgi:hypothetical protein